MIESEKTIAKNSEEVKMSKIKEAKLLVYLSEYSDLSERITNYLNMQSAFVAGLIVWVTAILIIWDQKDESFLIMWIGLTGFQLIEVILHGFRKDQYNIAFFLENRLKPRVKDIIGKDDFWKYQSFVIEEQTKLIYILIRDFGEVTLSFVLLSGLIYYRIYLGWAWEWEEVAILLNIILLISLIVQSIKLIAIRNKIKNDSN
jgi:hypothetical protein